MPTTTKKVLIAAAVLFLFSGALTTVGALFKLQHWPMAGGFLITGIGLNVLSYLLAGVGLVLYLRGKK